MNKLMTRTGRLGPALLLTLGLALSGCSKVPKTGADHAEAGMDAFLDGKYAEARASLLIALSQKPSDKNLLYFTALAYQHDFVIDSAYYYIKRANLLHPNDRELTEQFYDIANLYGEWDDAKKALFTLINLGDPLEKHIESLVDVLIKGGSVTNAYFYLRKWYLEFGLNDPGYFGQLASLAAKTDSTAVAHEVLDSAITRWGISDEYLVVRSQIFFQERKLDEAIALLRPLIAKQPDNHDLKMNLANALTNKQDLEAYSEALTIFQDLRQYVSDPVKIDSIITIVEQSRQELIDSK